MGKASTKGLVDAVQLFAPGKTTVTAFNTSVSSAGGPVQSTTKWVLVFADARCSVAFAKPDCNATANANFLLDTNCQGTMLVLENTHYPPIRIEQGTNYAVRGLSASGNFYLTEERV